VSLFFRHQQNFTLLSLTVQAFQNTGGEKLVTITIKLVFTNFKRKDVRQISFGGVLVDRQAIIDGQKCLNNSCGHLYFNRQITFDGLLVPKLNRMVSEMIQLKFKDLT
jgi:hypothetical protein